MELRMAEHPVPERLAKIIIADLVSWIAAFGLEGPEGVDQALAILKSLPDIDSETELDINWYAEAGAPTGVGFNLTARCLTLTVGDYDGSQEIYRCDAGFYPDADCGDLGAWIGHFRCLNAPAIDISVWGLPPKGKEVAPPSPREPPPRWSKRQTKQFYEDLASAEDRSHRRLKKLLDENPDLSSDQLMDKLFP